MYTESFIPLTVFSRRYCYHCTNSKLKKAEHPDEKNLIDVRAEVFVDLVTQRAGWGISLCAVIVPSFLATMHYGLFALGKSIVEKTTGYSSKLNLV